MRQHNLSHLAVLPHGHPVTFEDPTRLLWLCEEWKNRWNVERPYFNSTMKKNGGYKDGVEVQSLRLSARRTVTSRFSLAWQMIIPFYILWSGWWPMAGWAPPARCSYLSSAELLFTLPVPFTLCSSHCWTLSIWQNFSPVSKTRPPPGVLSPHCQLGAFLKPSPYN